MEQRHIPVHQSLHRHNLVLGAERELAMTSALIALLVGVGGMTAIVVAAQGSNPRTTRLARILRECAPLYFKQILLSGVTIE